MKFSTTINIQVPGTVNCVYPSPTEPTLISEAIKTIKEINAEELFITVGSIYVNGVWIPSLENRIEATVYTREGSLNNGAWFMYETQQYKPKGSYKTISGRGIGTLLDRLAEYAEGRIGVSLLFTYRGRQGQCLKQQTIFLTNGEVS
jgi:hypothetical protein